MRASYKSWTWLITIAAAALMALAAAMAHAADAAQSFNHFNTGYPLLGAHFGVECESCHQGGRFKGTPRLCAACHNGTTASGKPPTHASTSNACEACHMLSSWQQVRYDHIRFPFIINRKE